MTIDEARDADELLTALADIPPQLRSLALGGRGVKILREAADLCGVNAAELSKNQAITAIIENF